MVEGYEVVRDPIHGFIRIGEIERELIDTPAFQRLRYIRQLSMAYMVYPGAEHTRFAHSLGVMEFATKIFNVLTDKHADNLLSHWNNEEIARHRQLLRLAALLHDLGHTPFSHGSEHLLKSRRHEDFTVKIIRETEIGDIIERHKRQLGFDSTDVIALIVGRPLGKAAFLNNILSGELDSDRMDYLLRDSHYTGVGYGIFDHDRLIHTLTLVEQPEERGGGLILGIEDGGIHAAEGLILARYFMFLSVYFHRVRRAYDIHLLEFLTDILSKDGGDGYYPENIKKIY